MAECGESEGTLDERLERIEQKLDQLAAEGRNAGKAGAVSTVMALGLGMLSMSLAYLGFGESSLPQFVSLGGGLVSFVGAVVLVSLGWWADRRVSNEGRQQLDGSSGLRSGSDAASPSPSA